MIPPQTQGVRLNKLFFVSYCIFLTLGVVLPLLILGNEENPHWNLASIGALLIALVSSLRLSLMVYRGVVQPLLLTFWVFVCFWLGLATFAQTLSNDFFWLGYYSTWLQAQGVFVILFGLAMYEYGRKRSLLFKLSRFSIQLTITPIRIYVLSCFAIFVSVYAMMKLGGLAEVMVTRMEYSIAVYKSGAFSKANALMLQVALRVPPYVALLIAWFTWCNRKTMLTKFKDRVLLFIVVVGLLLLNLITNYPLALPRYWLGTIVLSLLFITFKHTKYTMANWVMGFIGVLLIVFPLTSQFRSMKTGDSFSTEAIGEIVSRFYHGDFDAYQQLLNTLIVVTRDGYCFGNNFLGALLFWVPRSVWHNKPLSSGQTISEGMMYHYTNLSEPLWAEAYYALGYVGVGVILYGYGYCSGLIDNEYQAVTSQKPFIILFVAFWMSFQIFFLRGDLMNGVAYSLPTIFVITLFFRLRIFRRIISGVSD